MSRKNLLEKNCIWIIVVCIFGIVFSNATFLFRTPVAADEMLQEEINSDVNGLFVPLPEGVSFDDVSIEYDWLAIRISVPDSSIVANEAYADSKAEVASKNFFYDNPLKGDGKHIKELLYGYVDGENIFDIHLDDLCECNAQAMDDGIMISIEPIVEKYDKIIVIDPAHGGEDTGTVSFGVKESYVNYKLSQAVAVEIENSTKTEADEDSAATSVADSNNERIGVFLTHKLDENPTTEERTQLIADLNADIVLHIECRGDIKTRTKCGMEIVESAEKISKGNGAVGAIDEPYRNVKVINCYAGYLTNKIDATKLSDETYIADVAKELSTAVLDGLKIKN